MNTSILLVAQQSQQGGMMSMFVMMALIFVVMWFFMIRPQQKKQKEIRAFQNSLQEGTKVVTGGGIYGTVKHIDLAANVIEVEIAKGTVIRVDKGYVLLMRQLHKCSRHRPNNRSLFQETNRQTKGRILPTVLPYNKRWGRISLLAYR